MLTVADVFKSNLFGTTSLTHAINEIAYVPQRLMELDLFDVQGIPTTTAFIEKVGETLTLVQSTPRGGPGQSVAIDRREAVPFQSVHLQVDDKIYADEIQNVRSFGTNNQLLGVTEVRDGRLLKHSRSLDLTLEYHRVGATQGLILDADGSVIDDLFDKFGIAEPADVGLELEAAWQDTDGSPVKKRITGVVRSIETDLGGLKATGYHALCGDDFFDALTNHPETRALYLQTSAAQELRNSLNPGSAAPRTFSYGDVTFENYRGQGAVSIPTDEARVFPLGVPGLFAQLFAPADTMEAVNTLGLVKYAMAAPDPSGFNKFIALEAQSNPITYCTRPKVLRRLVLGAA